ncbi:elongation factor Tu [Hydrogenivirga sp. 128-5-R1-1]|nr:elongation factor Tu [Hydrogenivirga sp. 128-5-R1-1]
MLVNLKLLIKKLSKLKQQVKVNSLDSLVVEVSTVMQLLKLNLLKIKNTNL